MRILIVDDHPITRVVLDELARRTFKDVSVEGAVDLDDALQKAQADPDIVFLDLGLPGFRGIEALVSFLSAFSRPRVVVFSAWEERAIINAALNAGAAGYVPKTHRPELISAAMQVVAAGGTYVPYQALAGDDMPSARLTERQQEVMSFIAQGFSNKQVAERLGICEDTVKHHACAAYAVLGVGSRTQAVAAMGRYHRSGQISSESEGGATFG
jgi:two-component system, NarL family, nitrate/nitrite response regulator NarL